MNKKKIKKILNHLACMCFLTIAMLLTFFYTVLPYITNHGKMVKVPDLTGVHADVLHENLSKYHLRYVIADHSGYSAQLPSGTVLQQFPAANALVKHNRKIYVTLNADSPPLVRMPNLIEGSTRQAQFLLKNRGLKLGNIKYVADFAKGAVLEQWHHGHPIAEGKAIIKGSVIDLVVGAGLGRQIIDVPDILKMPLEEVHLVLLERGIRIGVVHVVQNSTTAIGAVIRQNPTPGTKVPLGTAINLWVAGL